LVPIALVLVTVCNCIIQVVVLTIEVDQRQPNTSALMPGMMILPDTVSSKSVSRPYRVMSDLVISLLLR